MFLQNGRLAFRVFAFPTVVIDLARELTLHETILVKKGKSCAFKLGDTPSDYFSATQLQLLFLEIDSSAEGGIVRGSTTVDVSKMIVQVLHAT